MAKDYIFHLERFQGLHVSQDLSHELSDGESPDMLNFQVTSGEKLRKREGFFALWRTSGLRGIWCGSLKGETYYLAVKGNTLYASREGFASPVAVEGTVAGEESVTFFPFGEGIYLLTGEEISRFDGQTLAVPEPYVPLVMVATTPQGVGVTFEDVNLLTRTVRQSFSATGTDKNFYPIYPAVARVEGVKVNGKEWERDQFVWDSLTCSVQFANAPPEGVDNVEITYTLLGESPAYRIHRCRFGVGFGGANDTRAFLYGNREQPAIRYHSGVVDGRPCMEYFPEMGYTLVGNGAPITAILRHYDRQLIFTKEAAYYSYLDYLTMENGKLVASFPVLPLSDETGHLAEGQALLMENDPVTVSEGGLYRWISTNVRDERNAKCFSERIAPRLREERLSGAKLYNRRDTSELLLWIGGHLFVYQYRLKVFYYYCMPEILNFCQDEEGVYFATAEGVFQVGGSTDDGQQIPAYWESRAFYFSDYGRYKNLHRASLFATAGVGMKAEFSLKREKGREEKSVLDFSGTGEVEQKNRRSIARRFIHVKARVVANGVAPFHLYGLELQGRITDQSIKE